MTVTLRDIRAEDEPFLFRIYAASRADEMKLVPWTEEQREKFLRMQYEAQRDHYYKYFPAADYKVIVLNQEVVGRLYVLREAGANRILDIAILPEMRRRGIASQLLAGLLREAEQARKPLQIYVETFNPALGWFERLGFSRIDEDGINFLLEFRSPTAAAGS